ncbi:hypothetical protein LOD99_9479 [Oopsacas minuta]|uniref:Methyltransferase type 11 domain-containing protein n=1 Tax=Oopsacas minuta TaxID=111878 RepID=A0AAV7JBN6_9METZ|nr:hypothetical protein LOD99_9479 [Oopsacas minuta]
MAFASEKMNTLYRMFEDSSHAENYSMYRLGYPEELKQSILTFMADNGCNQSDTRLLLDIGCGTGISTRLFSDSCTSCWGVDISYEQLKQAISRKGRNVFYLMSLAESTCFKDNTFDLITVGQAWHWFDADRFNEEVKRILAPHGCIAVYGYSFPTILNHDKAQEILYKFYTVTLAPYWSERRELVRSHYSSLVLPFKTKFRNDNLSINVKVTLNGLLNYIDTTSAAHLMNKINPGNTITKDFKQELAVAIGGSDVSKDFNPLLDIRASVFMEIAKKD